MDSSVALLAHSSQELQAGLASGRIAQTDPVLLIDGWDCPVLRRHPQ